MGNQTGAKARDHDHDPAGRLFLGVPLGQRSQFSRRDAGCRGAFWPRDGYALYVLSDHCPCRGSIDLDVQSRAMAGIRPVVWEWRAASDQEIVSAFRIAGRHSGAGVLLVSPWLLQIWTHGRIEFVPRLMLWMLAYAAISGIWHVPRVLLMSTNQHVGLAGWSLAAGGLAVLLAWLFG